MTDADNQEKTTEEVTRAMRLRPAPPKVMRLSRKALTIGAACLSVVGGGLLVVALRQGATGAPAGPELYRPAETTPEQVRALPDTYTGPHLGRPLPGDLGHAMLENQRDSDASGDAGRDDGCLASSTPASDPTETARQQALEQERQMGEAAVSSSLFFKNGVVAATPTPPATPLPQSLSPAATTEGGTEGAKAIDAALWPGTVISGALITGLRSDLPGPALGQVVEDVLDSLTGRTVVIPRGARLVGAYDAQVVQGQSRLKVVWTQLVLPDGRRVALGEAAASDAQGYAGLEDGVDHRWGERWRAAGLTTLLSVSTAAVDGDEDDRLVQALRDGAGSGVDQVGRSVLAQGLSLPPRLKVRPGFAFSIILTEPLSIVPTGG